MSIDKSWIGKPQNTPEYVDGVRKFSDFAFEHGSIDGLVIKCPYSRYGLNKWQRRDIVQEHLILKPFLDKFKFSIYMVKIQIQLWYKRFRVHVSQKRLCSLIIQLN